MWTLMVARRAKPCGSSLHPSEDGEALRKFDPLQIPQSASATIESMTESVPASCWFAVYTASRHEKKVAFHLEQRAVEHVLPPYRANRKWKDGSRVTLHLPLFPGYLLVRICKSQRGSVLGVPGAPALVDGVGGVPASIPDGVLEALRNGIAEDSIEPHGELAIGQMARIRNGSFAGMEGVVLRTKSGLRVVLTLSAQRLHFSVVTRCAFRRGQIAFISAGFSDVFRLRSGMCRATGPLGSSCLYCGAFGVGCRLLAA